MSRVVIATGAAVGRNDERTERSAIIEAAMVEAIMRLDADGVTDENERRGAILKARDAAAGE